MSTWQNGRPPNETLVEVEDDERGIIRVRAIWGRDGMLPHWESEDRGMLWSPNAFGRWRPIDSATPSAQAKRADSPRRSAAQKP